MKQLTTQYDLFKDDVKESFFKVCWIRTSASFGNHGRKDKDTSAAVNSFGAQAIQADMSMNYDIVTIDKICNYDKALVSLTSVVEIQNLLIDINKYKPYKGNCEVIVGGMGCLNVYPIYDFIDVAIFGRGEDQINDIIYGKNFANVWRKKDDPLFNKKYIIRQAEHLLSGEKGIGCPNNCSYCQYTNVRKYYFEDGKGYRAADIGSVYEDDWNRIEFRQGRNQTAWDGLSDDTRLRVHKPVTNQKIIDKLADLRSRNYTKTCNLKIFQIVGFPWETPVSVSKNLDELYFLLNECDGNTGGRIFIMFLVTPLSPEPLTPLESYDVSFYDWRDVIMNHSYITGRACQAYNGKKIEAMFLPQICGQLTLQKRVALNRCNLNNKNKVIDFVLHSKEYISDIDFYGKDGLNCSWQGQTDFLYTDFKWNKKNAI